MKKTKAAPNSGPPLFLKNSPQSSWPMPLTFQKGKTIGGKTIKKPYWYHQKNAHHEATRSRKNFSALHFSVIIFLKS
jgi:hypothetical protein